MDNETWLGLIFAGLLTASLALGLGPLAEYFAGLNLTYNLSRWVLYGQTECAYGDGERTKPT